jgi:hypothetical protein
MRYSNRSFELRLETNHTGIDLSQVVRHDISSVCKICVTLGFIKHCDYSIEKMSDLMDSYCGRGKKLPSRLRKFDSYSQLKKEFEEFQMVPPLPENYPKILSKRYIGRRL